MTGYTYGNSYPSLICLPLPVPPLRSVPSSTRFETSGRKVRDETVEPS